MVTLSEWLKSHHGAQVRIGTDAGSGFVYTGNVDSTTARTVNAKTHSQMYIREVVEEYKSTFNDDLIVLVKGNEYGKQDTGRRIKPYPDLPIEQYRLLAAEIAKGVVMDYEHALMRNRSSIYKRSADSSELEIKLCREFLLSDSFAVMMPNVDGADLLRLIERKVGYKMDG